MGRGSYANGTTSSQGFDPAGNLTQIVNAAASGTTTFTYCYDNSNRKTLEESSDSTVTSWTLDPTGRLTDEQRTAGDAESQNSFNITYTYDRPATA